MTEKTAYVVMLPLTDEQKASVDLAVYDGEYDRLVRAIGAPVDSSVPVVLVGITDRAGVHHIVPARPSDEDMSEHELWIEKRYVNQSDHLAALAEKQAEVDRLRISECKMKEAAVHLMRTMRRDDLTKAERIDAAIRQINARLISELEGAAS